MNSRGVAAIVRRDLARIRDSKPVLLPLIIVPVLLLVVIPLIVGMLPRVIGSMGGMGDVQVFLDQLPDAVTNSLPLDDRDRIAAVALVYLVAPIYLIVPLMVAIVIAADSFAGERERGTLEFLLNAPVTDLELLTAKMTSALVPAVAVAVGGAMVYGLVANLATGIVLFPNLLWVGLALWVAPGVAALGLGTTVIISARVKGFQEANQMAGIVVLPVVMLTVAQAAGALLLSPLVVVILGTVVWAAAVTVIYVGAKTFKRTTLGARL